MRKHTALLTLIALLLPSIRIFAQQWQTVGPDDNSQLYPSYSLPYSASIVNSTPYVLLFGAIDNGSNLIFRRLNAGGTAWETVSHGYIPFAGDVTGAIADDNTPYVAYIDQENAVEKMCVRKANPIHSGWDTVGRQDFTPGRVKYEIIAFNGKKLYAAFSDEASGGKLTVMKLDDNGIDWHIVGNAGFSTGTADDINMSFIDTTAYIAFRDAGTGGKARLMRLNSPGTVWENAGPAAISPFEIAGISFAINNSTPYVAFIESTLSNNNLFVKKLNATGTAWVDVSATPIPAIGLKVQLQFDGSTPYITFQDYSHDYRASVLKLNPTSAAWQLVGNADVSSDIALNSILRINNGQPYLFFSDGGFREKARALKLNAAGTLWQDITTPGFSAGEPQTPNIVFNNGVPYVIYGLGLNPQRATLMNFKNGQWQVVGTPGFTFQAQVNNKIPLIFKGNVPYVAYMDGNQSDKLSVKRLNAAGTDWEQVGGAGFTDGGKGGINLVIDTANTGNPVIYAAAGGAIMKLGAGNVWQSAAPAINDAGESVDNVSLAINNSTLYVAYHSLTVGGIKVKKMNASGGWDIVGSGPFSIANVRSLSLVFDNSVPYVCSSDGLFKLNPAATGWDRVGKSPGSYLVYPKLAFEAHVPYMSFVGDIDQNNVQVIYYDSGADVWKNLGKTNGNIATGEAFNGCLAINNNKVYEVLNESGAFVKVFSLDLAISSFSPSTANTGSTVTIKGQNFIDVQSVAFGGMAAKMYTVVSDSVITAVVAAGASGDITVLTARGSARRSGFIFAGSLPAINYFSPVKASENTEVVIAGNNLSNTTAVSFGGVPATSFKINSANSVTAVVGNGQSGNVVITTTYGSASRSGFTYLPVTVRSFSPAAAKPGTIVEIVGTDFTGATAVTFAGQPAASFIVNSATSITAVVGSGASGSVAVTTPEGTATLAGFTFISTSPPVISSFSPIQAATGDTVTITGTTLNGATAVSFGNTPAAVFLVKSATQVKAVVGQGSSGEVSLTTSSGTTTLNGFNYIFKLLADNFSLAATSATCKGNADGTIKINAKQSLNYAAHITGNTINKAYSFTNSVTIDSLAAGTYNVCFTINNQVGYNSCYSLVVTEPKDLSVYSALDGDDNTLKLQMSGGAVYNIMLNGKLFTTTTNRTATIPLPDGDNDVTIATDKFCQGVVEKKVSVAPRLVPYPNPFDESLSINLSNKTAGKVTVAMELVSDGKQVFYNEYLNKSGVLQVDLSGLASGIYVLRVIADNLNRAFKVIKK